MTVASPERTRDDVIRLAHRGMGVREYSLAAARAVGRVVPFDGVCVLTMDPATMLPTGHVIENALPAAAMARYSEIEIREPDYNKFTTLARAQQPAASLSEATEGRLDRSVRHRELRRPSGFADELRAVFAADAQAWGGIVLLRETGRQDFMPADARVLASLSPYLAEGLRRAVLLSRLSAPGEADDAAPGLLTLGDDGVELADAAARRWLAELGTEGDRDVPLSVQTVADRARSVAAGAEGVARARVRTASGRWLHVRGTMLGDRPAVILEPVRPPELAPLIADAHGLTARERLVTRLVAQGLPTDAIARKLHLSPYTVQDHLKAIFGKLDVSSRGELVARLYFDHYARVGPGP
jgi:DNA-binding CsgD family transcriptional regulator